MAVKSAPRVTQGTDACDYCGHTGQVKVGRADVGIIVRWCVDMEACDERYQNRKRRTR